MIFEKQIFHKSDKVIVELRNICFKIIKGVV
jgi:hypothetical protein